MDSSRAAHCRPERISLIVLGLLPRNGRRRGNEVQSGNFIIQLTYSAATHTQVVILRLSGA